MLFCNCLRWNMLGVFGCGSAGIGEFCRVVKFCGRGNCEMVLDDSGWFKLAWKYRFGWEGGTCFGVRVQAVATGGRYPNLQSRRGGARLAIVSISFWHGDTTVGRARSVIAGVRMGMLGGLLLLEALAASAAPELKPYRIDRWQMDEGLPQSSVTSIVQARDGYLWLGTFDGLARFDGMQFKVFNPNNAPGLASRRIVQLHEDRLGVLWIATEEGDLVKCADGRFHAYLPPHRGTAKFIRNFADTADGALWMRTEEAQLVRFAAGQFTVVSTNWNLRGTVVNGMVTDSSGQLWVSTDKELAVWRDGTFDIVWNPTRGENLGIDPLAPSRLGGCWVAGKGRLRRFDHGGWVADYGAYPWSKGGSSCALEDRRGQLWIGTYGSGLFCYDTNGVA